MSGTYSPEVIEGILLYTSTWATFEFLAYYPDLIERTALLEDGSWWIRKIETEKRGHVVDPSIFDKSVAYQTYFSKTANKGVLLTEENVLSYPYPVRDFYVSRLCVWAITLEGRVILRDTEDPYRHWKVITKFPRKVCLMSPDPSGNNAIIMGEYSDLYLLRARGEVVLGPITLGVGPIVDILFGESSCRVSTERGDQYEFDPYGRSVDLSFVEKESLIVPPLVTSENSLVTYSLSRKNRLKEPPLPYSPPLEGLDPYSIEWKGSAIIRKVEGPENILERDSEEMRDLKTEHDQAVQEAAFEYENETGDDYMPDGDTN